MILDLHSNLKLGSRFFPAKTYEDPPAVLVEEFEANPRLFTEVKVKSKTKSPTKPNPKSTAKSKSKAKTKKESE